ncbi:MAG: DUF2336 domain-containing protein [Pseudomonadota bacterium]
MQDASNPIIVSRFLNWKETADVSKRAAAASALARAYLQSDLPFAERCAAEAALTDLTDDPSPRVRMALAEVMSTATAAPEQILVTLLRDRFDIASLIVARSPRVREMDLVERVRCGDPKLQVLIAQRGEIGRTLAHALSRHGDAEAVFAMLANANARVCAECRSLIVERFSNDPEIRGQLLQSRDLEPQLRYKLTVAATEAIRTAQLSVTLLGPQAAQDAVEAELQRCLVHVIALAPADHCEALIDVMREDGRLTTALTIRVACHGHMDFLIDVVSGLSERTRNSVTDIFASGRVGQLSTLMQTAGFADAVAHVLVQAIIKWRLIGQGKLHAGVQEITHAIMEEISSNGAGPHDPANDDLEGLLRSIYLDAVRTNARSHARSVAQLQAA